MNAVYQMKLTLGKTLVMFSIVAFMWISLPRTVMATTKDQPCIACTQAVLKVAAEEAAKSITIENWMVNDEYWTLGTQDDVVEQEQMPLENWMFTMGEEVNQLPDENINLEEWMLDSFYWGIDSKMSMARSQTETLGIHDWMFENNFWTI